MKKQGINPVNWSKNIIIVDADFVDHVAFDLIVNFERMLGRRIPQADLRQWLGGGPGEGVHQGRHPPAID